MEARISACLRRRRNSKPFPSCIRSCRSVRVESRIFPSRCVAHSDWHQSCRPGRFSSVCLLTSGPKRWRNHRSFPWQGRRPQIVFTRTPVRLNWRLNGCLPRIIHCSSRGRSYRVGVVWPSWSHYPTSWARQSAVILHRVAHRWVFPATTRITLAQCAGLSRRQRPSM